MKKNLFWSLLAATAMLTACGDDSLVDQPVVTGPETAVAFKINMGNGIQTYATDVAKGGWTNYRANELTGFYARATVQVFAAGSTTTAPLAEARTVLEKVLGAGNATGDVINVPNLRLPAGATYTAVVWVDFIKSTASKVDARNDYYWDTENLSAVKDLRMQEGLALIDGNDSPESRDAYTSTLKFTVNANGTYQAGDQFGAAGTDNATALEITARRTLAKVSLVLTDYDTKEAWANAFNNVDANRKLNYLAMGVTNLATEYNALTQQPKVTNAAYYFHRNFTIPADKNATDVNGVKWIEENSKFYPVMDFNYVIPAVAEKNSANAVYSLVFKGYNHGTAAGFTATQAALTDISTSTIADNWKLVAKRNASSVPVRTNAHTIIKLNLYKEYSCNVTIVDLFDGGKENVTVNDDDTKGSIDDHYINENGPINDGNTTGAAHVVVERGNDGIATSITITGVTAANFNKVMEDIEAMAKLGAVDINMTAITIPANADFSKVPATNKVVLTVTAQEANTSLSGMNGNIDLSITPVAGQTPTVTATSDHTVTFVGGTYKATVKVDAENANFTNGTYKATVTINQNKTDKNASISGGTYEATVSSYSDTSISGGSSSGSNPAFTMENKTNIKTIKIGGSAVFGKLNAYQFSTTQAGDNHVLDFQHNNALYNLYNNGGNLVTNFNCININNQ